MDRGPYAGPVGWLNAAGEGLTFGQAAQTGVIDRTSATVTLHEGDRVVAQYTALDRNMGQLSGLSSYITQQMQALNNFYTARSNSR